jgi:putative transposase
LLTYKFRIKDSNKIKILKQMASDVNFVWNHVNSYIIKRWKESRKYTSPSDACVVVVGASSVLSIASTTSQAVAQECALRTKKAKKRVRFRTAKKGRNLGWVPFKAASIKFKDGIATYNRHHFRVWNSRDLPEDAKIKVGSFTEDSRGRWYLNITFEAQSVKAPAPEGTEVALDLGLKTVATTSRGRKYERENLTRKYQEKLAKAQKFKKKKKTKKIHAKIKNIRQDFNHKISTELAKENRLVIAGDVDSSKLAKTNMAKSTYDAGWYQLKTFLKYKCQSRSGVFLEVSERFSSVTCSNCHQKTGPSGLSDLGIREWQCSHCGKVHDRDVNAAINILRFGRDSLRASNPKGLLPR